MVRHGFEEPCQGVEEGICVKSGVEPDTVGGQGGSEVGHCELVVAFAFETDGICELVLVKVYDFRQVGDFDRGQGRELREIQHVAAKDEVEGLVFFEEVFCLLGEGNGRVSHSPFPLVCRQGEGCPGVFACVREAVEKGLMTSSVVWFKCQNVHADILRKMINKSSSEIFESLGDKC